MSGLMEQLDRLLASGRLVDTAPEVARGIRPGPARQPQPGDLTRDDLADAMGLRDITPTPLGRDLEIRS